MVVTVLSVRKQHGLYIRSLIAFLITQKYKKCVI